MNAIIKHINTRLFGILCLVLLGLTPKLIFAQTAEIKIETEQLSTLEDIFNLIKSKTDYEFVYRSDLIKSAPKVFLHKGKYKVDALLKKGLSPIDCTYKFENNKTIIVYKKSKQPKQIAAASKTISGKITFAAQAVPNVNIRIKNTNQGTKTDQKGNYSIEVEIGDVLQYSHVSFKTISIIIEDVTRVLNLEMESQMNTLNETVVVAKKKQDSPFSYAEAYDKEVLTAAGKIYPMLFPSKVHYFSGKDIGSQYLTLTDALRGKFSGSLPNIFDVDGVIYPDDSFININRIKDIYIVTGSAGTARWGGPFVIVSTMDAPEEIQKRKEEVAELYRNQNYYQDDAKAIAPSNSLSSETVKTATGTPKTINGNITHLGMPLEKVSIRLKYQKGGTTTDAYGNYQILGEVGDVLEYRHLGFKTIAIVIEDITEVLDLEMVPKNNALEEVVVIAKTNQGEILPDAKRAQQGFTTARGKMNPKRAGYSIDFIGGDEIVGVYSSLSEALLGKIPGAQLDAITKRLIVKPKTSIQNSPYPIWDVDGSIYDNEPPLQLSNIVSVNVLKTVSGTSRYGATATGGVIVVKTKSGDFSMADANLQRITNQYTNNNYYANDAVNTSIEQQFSNPYTKLLQDLGNKFQAFEFYNQNLKHTITDYVTHIDIAQSFGLFYNDVNLASQILDQLIDTYDKNPEILKAIAYQLQTIGDTRNAVKAYKKVIQLRPKYAQSYRDLANAYKENNQFKKAWRVYMNYLMQGNDISGEGIGQLLYNEMEYLYYNRSHQTKIKERFVPKNETLTDFRNDVRLVFEWNTSEAEFDLEFVSPEKRAYVFEHTLTANQELITDEKEKGFSSRDFIIEYLEDGQWLVNITYRGNKKPEPSYLKVTQYFNWGKSSQTQETAVYKFENLREKIQLIKLSKQRLLANN